MKRDLAYLLDIATVCANIIELIEGKTKEIPKLLEFVLPLLPQDHKTIN